MEAPAVTLALTLGRTLVSEHRLAQPVIRVGRDASADISIDNPGISREHCEIVFRETHYMLLDLGTANGTDLNGIGIKQEAALKAGDEIGLGKFSVLFDPDKKTLAKYERASRASSKAAADDAPSTLFLSPDEVKNLKANMAQKKAAHLRYVNDAGKPKGDPIMLEKRVMVMGRAKDADIELSGWFIKPDQVVLTKDGDHVVLTHSGGMRGIFVNGRKVKEKTLKHEDLLRVGPNRFRFYAEI